MNLNKKNLTHNIIKAAYPENSGIGIQLDVYSYTTSKGNIHAIGINTLTTDNLVLYGDAIRKSKPTVGYYVNEVQWNHPSDVHLALAETFSLRSIVLTEHEEEKLEEEKLFKAWLNDESKEKFEDWKVKS